jgi:hypothetical protein
MKKKSRTKLFSYVKAIKISEDNQELHLMFQAAIIYISAMQDEGRISDNVYSRLMNVIMSTY